MQKCPCHFTSNPRPVISIVSWHFMFSGTGFSTGATCVLRSIDDRVCFRLLNLPYTIRRLVLLKFICSPIIWTSCNWIMYPSQWANSVTTAAWKLCHSSCRSFGSNPNSFLSSMITSQVSIKILPENKEELSQLSILFYFHDIFMSRC